MLFINYLVTLKEAKERAHLLFTSIGKYQNTSPFLFPLFGWSQLAEGFSRKASVLGTQCMLRTKLSLEDPRSGNEFLLSFDNGTTWKSGLLERDTPAPDTFSSFRFDLKASEENPNLISQEPFFLVIPPSIASCLKGNPAYILFLTRDFYPSEAVDRCYLFSITATFTAEDLDVFLGFAGITTYTTSAESFNSVYGSPNCNSFSLDLLSLQMDAKVRQILSSLHL